MKTARVILLMCLICSNLLFSQHKNHHGKGTKGHHQKHVIHKKAHPQHYSRKRIVVLRPRQSKTVAILPNGYTTIVYRNNNHYCHAGRFYRYHLNSYVLMAPPVGIRIAVLPVGYRKVYFGPNPYFYYQGVYYSKADNDYEVVNPETGVLVPDLPEDLTEEITIDGKKYYEYDNYLYKLTQTKDGVMYEVVAKLED